MNMPSDSAKRIEEYQARYQLWTSRAVEQFSFSNNLLLIISIASLGYFYKEGQDKFTDLTIWWFSGPINWQATFFSIGTVFTGLAIIFGVIVALARLYDFNLTRHIALIRKRIFSKHNEIFPDEVVNEKKITESLLDLINILIRFGHYKISKDLCAEYNDELKNKFKEIRAVTNGFGKLSWVAFRFQISSFLLGLFFYILLMLS